jgi:tRNA-guanine transglycosylase
MDNAREAIIDGRFKEYKEEVLKNYAMGKESDWIKPKSI